MRKSWYFSGAFARMCARHSSSLKCRTPEKLSFQLMKEMSIVLAMMAR